MRKTHLLTALLASAFAVDAEAQHQRGAEVRQFGIGRRTTDMESVLDRMHTTQSRLRRYGPARSPFGLLQRSGRMNAYGRRARGMMTRPNRIRQELLGSSHKVFSLLPRLRPSADPINKLLDRRNLLTGKSSIGRRTSMLIGRDDYRRDDDGNWIDALRPVPMPPPITAEQMRERIASQDFGEYLSKDLSAKADKYYAEAIEAFKNDNTLRAEEALELVRLVEPKRARAYVAGVLVCFQRGDMSMATTNLKRAIQYAQSRDELWIEWKQFYTEKEFRQIRDDVHHYARMTAGRIPGNMLFAFYSWLIGDTASAVSTLETVQEIVKGATEVQQLQTGLTDLTLGRGSLVDRLHGMLSHPDGLPPAVRGELRAPAPERE